MESFIDNPMLLCCPGPNDAMDPLHFIDSLRKSSTSETNLASTFSSEDFKLNVFPSTTSIRPEKVFKVILKQLFYFH